MDTAEQTGTYLETHEIDQANLLIEKLTELVSPEWKQLMQETLTDTEIEQANRNIIRAMHEMNVRGPVGAFIGSTGSAKEHSGLAGEDVQNALHALKQHWRLVQCGRGRGKLLVLIENSPLEGNIMISSSPLPKPSVGATALKDLENQVGSLSDEVSELRERVEKLN